MVRTLLERCLDGGSSIAFSPDGKLCAAGGAYCGNWDVKIWEVATGKEIAGFAANRDREKGVNCLAFSPDSRYVVARISHSYFRLWDRVTGKEVWTRWSPLFQGWTATCIRFSPDGRSVLACGPDCDFRGRNPTAKDRGHLVLLDAATGRDEGQFRAMKEWIAACAFAPDGRQIFAAPASGIGCFDATNGALQFRLKE